MIEGSLQASLFSAVGVSEVHCILNVTAIFQNELYASLIWAEICHYTKNLKHKVNPEKQISECVGIKMQVLELTKRVVNKTLE